MNIYKSRMLCVVFWLYNILPLNLARSFGRGFGKFLIRFKNKDFLVAKSQIKFALSLSEEKSEELARNNFYKMGCLTAEAFKINQILQTGKSQATQDKALSNFILEGDSEEILSIGREQGSIVISGHVSCFEILAAYYVKRGLDLWAIGKSPSFEWFRKRLEELREDYKVKSIWREEPNAGLKILRALKSGGTITALIDQDTRLENEFSSFFGLEAAFPSSLISLAIRKNIPIFSCFIVSHNSTQYKIRSKLLARESQNKSVKEILDLYNVELEKIIREHPEQWVWWHKRWRRRPNVDYKQFPKQLRSTDKYLLWMEELSNQKVQNKEIVENVVDKKRIIV